MRTTAQLSLFLIVQCNRLLEKFFVNIEVIITVELIEIDWRSATSNEIKVSFYGPSITR